jgi:hypothetical protein
MNTLTAFLNFVFVPGVAYGAQLARGALGITLVMFWSASPSGAFFGQDFNVECTSLKTCTGNGDCVPTERVVVITLRNVPPPYPEGNKFWPVEMTVDGMKHNADLFTESGPVFWDEMPATGNFLYLLIGGEAQLLWHRNDFRAGTTELTFMQCKDIPE